jgi:hypothetical protein
MQMMIDELEEILNVSFERKIGLDRCLHYNSSIDFRGIIDPEERG